MVPIAAPPASPSPPDRAFQHKRLPGFLLPAVREVSVKRATELDTGQRFRRESEANNTRSPAEAILPVDDAVASASSSFLMPLPLSRMRISRAAAFDITVNPRSARIKTVLNQLFHHRRGSLHQISAGATRFGELRAAEPDRIPCSLVNQHPARCRGAGGLRRFAARLIAR